MSTPTTIFTPAPDLADRVLDAIADPQQSLADIAKSNSTTIEALTLWMTSDGIRERLIATESAHCWRTRLVATTVLPQALNALTQVLHHPLFPGNSEDSPSCATDPGFAGSVPSTPIASPPSASGDRDSPDPSLGTRHSALGTPNSALCTQHSALLVHRAIESVRKAATTIFRLTRFRPLAYNAAPISQSDSRVPPAQNGAPTEPPADINPQTIQDLLALLAADAPIEEPAHPPAPQSAPAAAAPAPADLARPADATSAPAPAVNSTAAPSVPGRSAAPALRPSSPAPHHSRAANLIQAAGSTASPRGP